MAYNVVNWIYGANAYDAHVAVGQALILHNNRLELSSALKASLEADSTLEDVLAILLAEGEPAIHNTALRATVWDMLGRFGGRVAGRESSKAFATLDLLTETPVFGTLGLSYGPIAGTLVMKIYAYLVTKGGVNAWEELLNKFGVDRHVTAFVDDKAERRFLAEYIPKIVAMKETLRATQSQTKGKWYRESQRSKIAARVRANGTKDFERFLCDNYGVQVRSDCPERR